MGGEAGTANTTDRDGGMEGVKGEKEGSVVTEIVGTSIVPVDFGVGWWGKEGGRRSRELLRKVNGQRGCKTYEATSIYIPCRSGFFIQAESDSVHCEAREEGLQLLSGDVRGRSLKLWGWRWG